MIKQYLIGLVGAATLTAAPALAATYTTIDLTAIEGTTWGALNSSPVRIDFGPGFGTGSVTLSAIDHGVAVAGAPVVTGSFPQFTYTKTLEGGDTLVSTANGTGFLAPQTPWLVYSGFDLNFTLDSGTFDAGSLLTIGGLTFGDAMTAKSYFSTDDFGAPLSTSLPTFFGDSAPFTQIGTDSLGPVYGAGAAGSTDSRAFALLNDTNSFSIRLMSDGQTSKSLPAINFSFATMTSAVPEPATWAMMITGFGLTGAAIRRRRVAWTAAV